MRSELMPGYRPPDTRITTSPSGVSPEFTDRELYINKLMDIRENAYRKIAEITHRINEYDIADRAIPEGILTELNEWVDVAYQITWSLIRDLLAQQSLDIEKAYDQIADQAPVLSWFQEATHLFRQTIFQPHQSAETSETPAVDPDYLNPSELVSAKKALAGLYDTLLDVFCRLPNFRANTALVRAVLITIIIFTLLPTASANAPAHSSIDNPASPPAQVAAATHPDHLSTLLHEHLSEVFTPIPTYTNPATTPPPSPPESTVGHSQATPPYPEAPAPTPTVTTQDIVALATGGPELTSAQVNLLTQDLLTSITRFYAATNAEFNANDPSLLSAINDAVTNTHPEINPLTQLPSYKIAYDDVTFQISLVTPENIDAGDVPIWQVEQVLSDDLTAQLNPEEMPPKEAIQTPNLTLVTDQETISLVYDYIRQSPVSVPDFKSPEISQLTDGMKRALSATNVAIVDIDRPDNLFAHGSLVLDDEGGISLHTVAHVIFNQLYKIEGNQYVLKSPNSLFLVISDDLGLHCYRFQPETSDIFIDARGKQDGLAKITLERNLLGLETTLPTIKPIPYSQFLEKYVNEGERGRAYTYTTLHQFTPLFSQSGLVSDELGKLTSWSTSTAGSIAQISTAGDSGRGIWTTASTDDDTIYSDECYLIGVTRGGSQVDNDDSFYSIFYHSVMAYPY